MGFVSATETIWLFKLVHWPSSTVPLTLDSTKWSGSTHRSPVAWKTPHTDPVNIHPTLTQSTYTPQWPSQHTPHNDPVNTHPTLTQPTYTPQWPSQHTPHTDPVNNKIHPPMTQWPLPQQLSLTCTLTCTPLWPHQHTPHNDPVNLQNYTYITTQSLFERTHKSVDTWTSPQWLTPQWPGTHTLTCAYTCMHTHTHTQTHDTQCDKHT